MSKSYKPASAPIGPVATRRRLELAQTRVVKRLNPSQPGAMKLTRRYGDALVCVRYRHTADGTHRYTTVELVVDDGLVAHRVSPDETIVFVRFAFDDVKRRRCALSQGARWDARRRVWSMTVAAAKRLGWVKRIVKA